MTRMLWLTSALMAIGIAAGSLLIFGVAFLWAVEAIGVVWLMWLVGKWRGGSR